MKLKYNLIAFSLLGGVLAACDPMEDIYDEIDAQGITITKTEKEYVLTKADYSAISKLAKKDAKTKEDSTMAGRVASDMALNSFAKGDVYIPKILPQIYPSWGKGSSVGVTYNFKEDKSETLKKYFGVKLYTLNKEDYAKVWGSEGNDFLSPAYAPESAIPMVLADAFKDAREGSFALAEYMYSDKEPVGKVLLSEDFESFQKNDEILIDGWNQIVVKGTTKWTANAYNGVSAKFSAFRTEGEQENWLVTKAVKIDDAAATFTFDLVLGHFKGNPLDVYVSDSYANNGKIVESEWTKITDSFKYPEPNPTGFTSSTNVGKYSLKNYNGKSVYFAFRYAGSGEGVTTTVQVDNITVSTLKAIVEPHNDLYQFNGGTWAPYSNKEVLVVTPEDYAAMGAPGKHNNFSSSVKADDYLPILLKGKYPYAKEGDAQVVLYKFFKDKDRGTLVYADEYLYKEGVWTLNSNIVVRSMESYLHNGKEWLFDPTIIETVHEEDYAYLVEWAKTNKPEYVDKKYGNSEFWFGASSYHKNFNIKLADRRSNDPEGKIDKDDQKATEYILKMVQEGCQMILSHNHPDAPTQMNGVDLYYKIRPLLYDGRDKVIYSFRFKSLGNGKFEVAGEPEKIQ